MCFILKFYVIKNRAEIRAGQQAGVQHRCCPAQRRLHLRYKDVISVCVLNNPNHRNVNTFLTDSNIFVKRSNKPAERCILLQRA